MNKNGTHRGYPIHRHLGLPGIVFPMSQFCPCSYPLQAKAYEEELKAAQRELVALKQALAAAEARVQVGV
jgi:hypothetical protein